MRAGWQGCNLVEGARELLYSFDQRRTLHRTLSCFAPPFDGRLGYARLCEVMSQQFRLGRSSGNIFEQDLRDTTVNYLARLLSKLS